MVTGVKKGASSGQEGLPFLEMLLSLHYEKWWRRCGAWAVCVIHGTTREWRSSLC